jgi:hypothetical protein
VSGAKPKRVYHRLVIVATAPDTEIWLGDDAGFFVQKETGTLDTRLLPGEYVVEFGLGTTQYPIRLTADRSFTQAELARGPTCVRHISELADDSEG